MQSNSKLRQIGLLTALALAVAAGPALSQDADAAKNTKKTTQQKAKAEKPKPMEKDTTSNYPPTQVPGTGY